MKIKAVISVIFCVQMLFFGACAQKKEEKKINIPSVVGVQSIKSDVPWTTEYPAQVAGSVEIEIRAQVGGILKEKLFKEGQYVEANTQLFLIDPEPYQTALDKAKAGLSKSNAALKKAKTDFDRMKALLAEDAISKKEFDDASAAYDGAKAEIEVAKANLKDAEMNLKYTKVLAPISGIAGESKQDIGSLISITGEKGLLTTMVQIDPLTAVFSAPGAQADNLKKYTASGKLKTERPLGQGAVAVTAILDNSTEYPEKGKIVFIDSRQDANTGSIAIKAEFPNPQKRKMMMPGRFIRVKVEGAIYKDAVIVPQTAVVETAAGPTVYTVKEDSTAAAVPVTYINADNITIITSGLSGGETVISEGVLKVIPGKPVDLQKKEFALASKYITQTNTPSQTPLPQNTGADAVAASDTDTIKTNEVL